MFSEKLDTRVEPQAEASLREGPPQLPKVTPPGDSDRGTLGRGALTLV